MLDVSSSTTEDTAESSYLDDLASDTSGGDPGPPDPPSWWETPDSEYLAPVAVDPAIYGLDAGEVALSISEGGTEATDASNENSVASALLGVSSARADARPAGATSAPKTFSDWMRDPLGKGSAPAPAKPAPAPAPRDAKKQSVAPPRREPTSHSSFIAAQPVCDFGDQIVGERSRKEIVVFNVGPIEARVTTSLVGVPSTLSITEAPDRMRPSRDGVPPPIRFVFAPTDETALGGSLVVRMDWPPGDIASEEKRVEIRGTAHNRGSKTHADRSAEADQQRRRDAEDASTTAARDKTRKQTDNLRSRGEMGHEGHIDRLDELRSKLETRMRKVYDARKRGVNDAERNVGEFERKQAPPPVPSLIETLAWACLDGIGAGLAKSLSGLAKSGFEMALKGKKTEVDRNEYVFIPPTETETPAPEAVVGILSEAIRDGAKKVYAGAKKQVQGVQGGAGEGGHTSGSNDKDTKDAFFGTLNTSLFANVESTVSDTSWELRNAMLHVVVGDQAEIAFAIMNAAIRALDATTAEAQTSQRSSALDHWVRYLAQTSLGPVESPGGGETLTDMDGANHTGQEHSANISDKGPAHTFDGLVDLRFTVDPMNPQQPARLTSAKLHGVRQIVADDIAQRGLFAARVPIRAVGQNTNTVAALSVVRDEAEGIDYTDHMKMSWEEPDWFSRKAGSFRPTPEGQREGARMLLEDDLLGGSLAVPLVTDAAK